MACGAQWLVENCRLGRTVACGEQWFVENNGLGITLVWGDQWFGAEHWLWGKQWLRETNGLGRTFGMERRVVDRIRLINSQSKHLLIGHALLGAMRHVFVTIVAG